MPVYKTVRLPSIRPLQTEKKKMAKTHVNHTSTYYDTLRDKYKKLASNAQDKATRYMSKASTADQRYAAKYKEEVFGKERKTRKDKGTKRTGKPRKTRKDKGVKRKGKK